MPILQLSTGGEETDTITVTGGRMNIFIMVVQTSI